jgi:hypothetical protein
MARWIRDNRTATKAEVAGVFAEGLNKATEILLGDANLTVPHDEGILESSGTVVEATAANLQSGAGYNTPYAVKQHEDASKGRHHWLERTLAEQSDKYQRVVRDHINSQLR